MRRTVAIAFIIFWSTVGWSQQLYLNQGHLMEEAPYFNQEFIKTKQIRSIRANYAYKDQDVPIEDTRIFRVFEFNRNGFLIRFVETYDVGYKVDSTIIQYQYNDQNLLAKKEVEDIFGKCIYSYTYNEKGELWKSFYWRHKTDEHDLKEIAYEHYDQQTKRKWFNGEGRLFKEENVIEDAYGNVKEIISRMAIGAQRESQKFIYDNSGQLVKMIHSTKNAEVTYDYIFDAFGRPEIEWVKRDEKPLTKKEFLYREDLLYAHLERDELTKRIRIWEYDYKYF